MACGCSQVVVTVPACTECVEQITVCQDQTVELSIDATCTGSWTMVEDLSPSHGTITIDSGTGVITYDPDDTYVGDDIFQVTINCDGSLVACYTVKVNVEEVIADGWSVLTLTGSATCDVGTPYYKWSGFQIGVIELHPDSKDTDQVIKVLVNSYDEIANPDPTEGKIFLTVSCGGCDDGCEETVCFLWNPPTCVAGECPASDECDCSEYPCTIFDDVTGNCISTCDAGELCCTNVDPDGICAECCTDPDCPGDQTCTNGECGCDCPPTDTDPCPECCEETPCPPCFVCQDGTCVPIECPEGSVCDPITSTCVDCIEDADCDVPCEECDTDTNNCVPVPTNCTDPWSLECIECPECGLAIDYLGNPTVIECPLCEQCVDNECEPQQCIEGWIPNPSPVDETDCCIESECDENCDEAELVEQNFDLYMQFIGIDEGLNIARFNARWLPNNLNLPIETNLDADFAVNYSGSNVESDWQSVSSDGSFIVEVDLNDGNGFLIRAKIKGRTVVYEFWRFGNLYDDQFKLVSSGCIKIFKLIPEQDYTITAATATGGTILYPESFSWTASPEYEHVVVQVTGDGSVTVQAEYTAPIEGLCPVCDFTATFTECAGPCIDPEMTILTYWDGDVIHAYASVFNSDGTPILYTCSSPDFDEWDNASKDARGILAPDMYNPAVQDGCGTLPNSGFEPDFCADDLEFNCVQDSVDPNLPCGWVLNNGLQYIVQYVNGNYIEANIITKGATLCFGADTACGYFCDCIEVNSPLSCDDAADISLSILANDLCASDKITVCLNTADGTVGTLESLQWLVNGVAVSATEVTYPGCTRAYQLNDVIGTGYETFNGTVTIQVDGLNVIDPGPPALRCSFTATLATEVNCNTGACEISAVIPCYDCTALPLSPVITISDSPLGTTYNGFYTIDGGSMVGVSINPGASPFNFTGLPALTLGQPFHFELWAGDDTSCKVELDHTMGDNCCNTTTCNLEYDLPDVSCAQLQSGVSIFLEITGGFTGTTSCPVGSYCRNWTINELSLNGSDLVAQGSTIFTQQATPLGPYQQLLTNVGIGDELVIDIVDNYDSNCVLQETITFGEGCPGCNIAIDAGYACQNDQVSSLSYTISNGTANYDIVVYDSMMTAIVSTTVATATGSISISPAVANGAELTISVTDSEGCTNSKTFTIQCGVFPQDACDELPVITIVEDESGQGCTNDCDCTDDETCTDNVCVPGTNNCPTPPPPATRYEYVPCEANQLDDEIIPHDNGSFITFDVAPMTLDDDAFQSLTNKANVTGVGIGIKRKNGNYTGEQAIVVTVKKKLPKSKLLSKDLIPKTINGIKTDVVRSGAIVPFGYCPGNCCSPTVDLNDDDVPEYYGTGTCIQLPATASGSVQCFGTYQSGESLVYMCTEEVTCGSVTNLACDPHNNQYRPLKGGTNVGLSGYGSLGTLGMLCKDTTDGSIVGLTNNHVFRSYNDSINASGVTSCITTSQPNNTVVQPAGGSGVGTVKRNVQLSLSSAAPYPVNQVDAAICNVNVDFASTEILEIGTGPWEWATEAEIDALPVGTVVYKSGRTVGTANASGTVTIKDYSHYITYGCGSNTGRTFMTGQLHIEPIDDTERVGLPGDSGSMILAFIGGTLKVIGLLYAGSIIAELKDGEDPTLIASYEFGSRTIATPINVVADQMQVEAWDGTVVANSNASFIKVNETCYQRGSSSTDNITHYVDGEYGSCSECQNG